MLAAALASGSGCRTPTRTDTEHALIERIIDGDTVVLTDGRRIRLLGIDAPERGQGGRPDDCYAAEATAFLAGLIAAGGAVVRLEYEPERFDRYGRTLAYLWGGSEGEMLNEVMVREGYARYGDWGTSLRHRERLREAEARARSAWRGLWHPLACGGS